MKSRLSYSAVLCALLATLYQPSAGAQQSVGTTTDYLVTGNFYADLLEVTQYDEESGDYLPLDAFIYPQSPFTSATTFALRFSVDESVAGHTSLFNPARYFNGAVSGVSLDIDGTNVLTTSATETVQQFPGDTVDGTSYSARWSWSLFPGVPEDPAEAFKTLDSLLVFGAEPFENPPLLTNVIPLGINFALYDPTQTAYGASGHLDLITLTALELGKFPNKEFSIFWGVDYSGEGGPGGFDGDATYTAFFNITSVTDVSAVPLPATVWLLMSALGGLVIRKQLKA